MNQIWVFIGGDYYTYYDSEKTARLQYEYWCEEDDCDPNDETFYAYFQPLIDMEQIETEETIRAFYKEKK